jgi:hypothetical protein
MCNVNRWGSGDLTIPACLARVINSFPDTARSGAGDVVAVAYVGAFGPKPNEPGPTRTPIEE